MTPKTGLLRFQRYPVQYLCMTHLPKGMRIMSLDSNIIKAARNLMLAGVLPWMLLSPDITHAANASTAVASSERSTALPPEHIHARPGVVLTLFFATDSAELTTASRRALDAIAPPLRAHLAQGGHVVLNGHSDTTGTPDYNRDLSHLRARAVANYLQDAWDIPLMRLRVRAWGDSDLRRSDLPAHPENRRVEITQIESRDVGRHVGSLRLHGGEYLDLDDFGGAMAPLPYNRRIITHPAPRPRHR
jgi:outer membrane protein OmpA-like peptidoglycan-associated protein